MKTFQEKVDEAKARLDTKKGEEKRDNKGKFQKETWREKFGFLRIMWIVMWSVAIGSSYTYVALKAPEMFEAKVITIPVNHANAQTTEETISESANETVEAVSEKTGTFYTYNAEESQTDKNPYITASGRIVKDGIVANNCLPFGTRIIVDGIGELEVQDRMNSRYSCDDFDVFKENPKENFKWEKVKYKIL